MITTERTILLIAFWFFPVFEKGTWGGNRLRYFVLLRRVVIQTTSTIIRAKNIKLQFWTAGFV